MSFFDVNTALGHWPFRRLTNTTASELRVLLSLHDVTGAAVVNTHGLFYMNAHDANLELADWLADKQLTRANCKWAEMWGGVAAYSEGRAGVATASYLEGFADALLLARSVGDVERARRYESLVRGAARFVMQLQVRSEEAYFMRSPQDAVGGIRTSPSLNLLRIDHGQHAIIGLIKARQVLFPERD